MYLYRAPAFPFSRAVTPATFAGLVCWYRADTGVTKDGSDLVSAWADQSGNGRDLSQGTGSAQPLWVAGVSGGQPGITFDGSNDRMITAAYKKY